MSRCLLLDSDVKMAFLLSGRLVCGSNGMVWDRSGSPAARGPLNSRYHECQDHYLPR